jgi:hemerythrin-like metal-binding protein
MFFVLTEHLITGSDELDEQHQRIIDMANAIVQAQVKHDAGRIAPALNQLLQRAERHCASEEQLMAALGYPWLEPHRRAHRTFLADLRHVHDQHVQRGEALATQLLLDAVIRRGFLPHVRRSDARLARWLAKRSHRVGSRDEELAVWATVRSDRAQLFGAVVTEMPHVGAAK